MADTPTVTLRPGDGPELAIGSLVGRYRIEAVLGGGASGTVYRATDAGIGRAVVLKHVGADVQRNEALTLGALVHDSFRRIFDVAEADGQTYFVLEYIDGGTLKGAIDAHRADPRRAFSGQPFERAELYELGLTVAKGLAYLHAQGRLHGDLKPENILRAVERRVPPCWLISDLGLACPIVTPYRGKASAYSAPELLRGEGWSVASDIYGWGALMFDAAALDPAPQDREQRRRRALWPPDMFEHWGLLAPAIEKALKHSPQQRYPNAAALVTAWEDAFHGPRPKEIRSDVLMVISVGLQIESIVAGLCEHRPGRAVLVYSNDSRDKLDEIKRTCNDRRAPFPAETWEEIDVGNAEDLRTCLLSIRKKLNARVRQWRGETIVDYTGGTKCMSVALGVAALDWKCTLNYMGGGRDARGIVSGGQMFQRSEANPWDVLGYRVAGEAVTLTVKGAWASARDLLADHDRATDPDVKNSLRELHRLCAGYAAWDAADYLAAVDHLKNFAARDMAHFWPEADRDALAATVKHHVDFLQELIEEMKTPGPGLKWLSDMYADCQRRQSRKDYDDALARFYRLAEALGQFQFRVRELPGDVGRIKFSDMIKKHLKEDPFGDWCHKLGLLDKIELRHKTRLGHGVRTVDPGSVDDFDNAVQQLAEAIGVTFEPLPFPHLPPV